MKLDWSLFGKICFVFTLIFFFVYADFILVFVFFSLISGTYLSLQWLNERLKANKQVPTRETIRIIDEKGGEKNE